MGSNFPLIQPRPSPCGAQAALCSQRPFGEGRRLGWPVPTAGTPLLPWFVTHAAASHPELALLSLSSEAVVAGGGPANLFIRNFDV